MREKRYPQPDGITPQTEDIARYTADLARWVESQGCLFVDLTDNPRPDQSMYTKPGMIISAGSEASRDRNLRGEDTSALKRDDFPFLTYLGFSGRSSSPLYWSLPRRGQNFMLIIASYVFYGWEHPWFLLPLWASTLVDYSCALGMETLSE